VRFGVQHGVGDPAWSPAILDPDAVLRFATKAEAVGFDHLAFTDHPAPSVRWIDSGGEGAADPFTSLAFCAAGTHRIRLLTFVLVVAYRNPLIAAHQLATLDVLSGGRLTVGVGTGYLKSELFATGADPSERLADFDAGVDIMRDAWAGRTIDAEGRGVNARGVRVSPPVIQKPHPPLWIHGNSAFGLERAARYAQGWIGMFTTEALAATTRTVPIPDLATLGRRIRDLRVATEEAGRPADAVEVVAAGPFPQLDIRTGWQVDAFAARIDELESLGVESVLVTVCGDDPAASEDTIEAFARDFLA
jgi:probable F420-dependent oxidoreductase